MPIKVTCPKCQGVLHAPDDAGGKRGKCPTCGTVLSIPAAAPQSPPAFPGIGTTPSGFGVPPEPVPQAPRTATPAPAPHGMTATPGLPGLPINPGTYGLAGSQSGSSNALQSAMAGGVGRGPQDSDSRRSAAGRMPPPTFGSQMRAGEAPTARRVDDPEPWRKLRGAFWWIRTAAFLAILPVLGLCGLSLAIHFKVPVPDKTPGFLGNASLSSREEIRAAVALIPGLLAAFTLMIGRLLALRAPGRSYAWGLFFGAFGATGLAFLLGAAALIPTVQGMMKKTEFAPESIQAVFMHLGPTGAILFLVLGEIWFVIGLGRIGAALDDERLAARTSRFTLLLGFFAVFVAVLAFGWSHSPELVQKWYEEFVLKFWNKLGDHTAAARSVLCALSGLFVWLLYVRSLGAARRALRERIG